MPIMAKNIKDAIAETEKNKNNLVQAKTKIDNKIQNLGGQKPINIFDVANKIEGMVNTQYKKIAMGYVSSDFVQRVNTNTDGYNSKVIKLNINFIPKRIILINLEVERIHLGSSITGAPGKNTKAYIDSDSYAQSVFYYTKYSTGEISKVSLCGLKSKNLSNKSVTVEFQGILGEKTEISYNWIAIG